MDDAEIHSRIEELVAEEHELWKQEEDGTLPSDEHGRLAELKASLDQCWDLLRQRRALREAGYDPDVARARATDAVEGYEQ